MTGHSWRGAEVDWRQAPEQYGAIHFHDDDLEDAGWEPRLRAGRCPTTCRAASTPPGCVGDGGEESSRSSSGRRAGRRPRRSRSSPRRSATSRTRTSTSAIDNPGALAGFDRWDDDCSPRSHRTSTWPTTAARACTTTTATGSGVCYSSRLRPVVNMRPAVPHAPLDRGRPHQFTADLHLVDWLHEKGFDVDVITDEDLHEEGRPLLERYRVVLTGTPPRVLDGGDARRVQAYLGGGGRLMYLGGNGFYWVTSRRSRAAAHDRGPAPRPATRAWEPEPGEVHLARPASPAVCGAIAVGRRSGSSASASPRRATATGRPYGAARPSRSARRIGSSTASATTSSIGDLPGS